MLTEKLKLLIRGNPLLNLLVREPVARTKIALRQRRLRSYGARFRNGDAANGAVRERFQRGGAWAAGKVGSVECEALEFYLRFRAGAAPRRPWPQKLRHLLLVNAGVFPASDDALDEFGRRYLAAFAELDLLAAWGNPFEPRLIAQHLSPQAGLAWMGWSEPWRFAHPWTSFLQGRRVLVVHPFVDSIRQQYERRNRVWGAKQLLPDFELQTLRMPLSPGVVPPRETSWVERIDGLAAEITRREFDVALIGAGAASIVLAQVAKRRGAAALHLGGNTQILFGVMGARWEGHAELATFLNEHWTRPLPEESPAARGNVEGGCYW